MVVHPARLPMLALHGILDAILPQPRGGQRFAARTAALLRVILGIIMSIVGLLANNHTVDHIALVQATSAAGLPAGKRHPLTALRQDVDWLPLNTRILSRFRRLGGLNIAANASR